MRDLAFLGHIGDALDQGGLVHLIGQLANDQVEATRRISSTSIFEPTTMRP